MGPFTVIRGPSSSGKSALVRALKGIISNVRGKHFLSVGTSEDDTSTIHMESGEDFVQLQVGHKYSLFRDGNSTNYTKLAGSVPEDVTDFLKIDPISANSLSLNVSGQFDRPFLLDSTGSSIARVLGELTGVDLLLNAVREGKRRRDSLNSELNLRKIDLENCTEKLKSYSDLPDKVRLLTDIETEFEKVKSVHVRIQELDEITKEHDQLSLLAQLNKRELDTHQVDTNHVLQLVRQADELRSNLSELEVLSQQYLEKSKVESNTLNDLRSIEDSLSSINEEKDVFVQSLKICPVCGRG